MRLKIYLSLLGIIILVSCRSRSTDLQLRSPNQLGTILLSISDLAEIKDLDDGSIVQKKELPSSDTTKRLVFKEIDVKESMTLAMWITPHFTGRNGTIITLSHDEKDFPINSVLSIYLNKNRIAFMHQGKDVRKTDYDQNKSFTTYFMDREELQKEVSYFLTYTFSDSTANIFIDGKNYASYEKLPQLENFEYITFGYSWNEKGMKYKFDGYLKDVYIFEEALDSIAVNELMDFTHLIQDGR